MEYIHIRSLERYHPGITSEAHLEKYIIKNWKIFFTFDYYATRLKISKRSIVDLVGVDDNSFYLIELKFRPIRHKDELQVRRYRRDFIKTCPSKPVKTILIGYNQMSQHIEVKTCNIFM